MMKWLLIPLILLTTGPKEIARINRLKKEAELAYQQGNFQLAIEKYSYLRDSLEVTDPNLLLNLAHSHYQITDTASARELYAEVATSPSTKAKSIALQQLGVMAKKPETLQESLQYMKAALKADPTNEGARYDYEVVKKLIEKQKQEQQNQNQQQNQDQDQQDQEEQNDQNQEQQNQQNQQNQDQGEQNEQEQQEQQQQESQESEESKEGEQQEEQQQDGEETDEQQQQEQSVKEKLEQMNISEEKARMILEALRNNEIQYIQQQKRKAKKRPPSGKPDW